MNKKLLITITTVIFLLGGTFLALKFAQGYRLNLKKQKVTATGLLVANSFPKGASVFINDKLTTATDDTLNLPPGEYHVKIAKDGFIPWQKKLLLQKELVTQTNARLFPAVPDLKGLTFTGAVNPSASPDGYKLAFSVASASAKLKNGLWVLELENSTKGPRQIAENSTLFDFSNSQLTWSPDNEQILARTDKSAVLLDSSRFNKSSDLKDVSAALTLILKEWQEQIAIKKKRQLEKLPLEMEKIATQSAKNVYFSPDEEKMLYTATASASIPETLSPPLPATSTQPEQRQIEPNRVYVYDIKEDKNFYITDSEDQTTTEISLAPKEATSSTEIKNQIKAIEKEYSPLGYQKLQWFPTSQHLIAINGEKITILEYDNTNQATIFAGDFKDSFVFPTPDGSKIVILTSLTSNPNLPYNLYAIDLK